MHRAQVQPQARSEHRPQVWGQVRDVEAVSGCADNRLDALVAAVDEGHLISARLNDRGPADDRPGPYLPAVVLAQRMTGDKEIRVGLGRSEVGRIPGDVQHPLSK